MQILHVKRCLMDTKKRRCYKCSSPYTYNTHLKRLCPCIMQTMFQYRLPRHVCKRIVDLAGIEPTCDQLRFQLIMSQSLYRSVSLLLLQTRSGLTSNISSRDLFIRDLFSQTLTLSFFYNANILKFSHITKYFKLKIINPTSQNR